LKRPYLRALLASAAVAAAISLAGCDSESIAPSGRSQAPLSEKTLAEIASKNMDKDSPILARIFKEEAELEIWKKNRNGEYALLKSYPICRWSGDLGPKKKEGDRQAPEGFYTITPGQMNPASNYYLAFNTGFPNTYDRAWGYTGSELMVHGDCSSRGCYAMTDAQIQEIYALARESFFGGQNAFQLEAFPFRMTALNMAKHRNNPNFAFWKMLKEGYDHFEATKQEPKVAVCEKRYVFDPAAPENGKPLKFDAKGQCPAYELDKTIADAVLEKRRTEQYQMAEYIARGVATMPSRQGIDGGMNPVFAAKLGVPTDPENGGRVIDLASVSGAAAPGALPRTPNKPGSFAKPIVGPVRVASAPAAPQPQETETPAAQQASIAGVLGNFFGNSQAEAKPVAPAADNEPVALRGSKTPAAAKPKPAPVTRIAVAPHAQPKPHNVATVVPPAHAVAAEAAEPAPKSAVKEATAKPAPTRTADAEMRSAFSARQETSNGLLAGAQPVVPVGTFDSRWSGLR
jgi:murein L,D-transpeptidase YafK